jgi:aspartyl-tRNA(Asn)/glutamyl-tRNA(Gln) amidotransferase subunit B
MGDVLGWVNQRSADFSDFPLAAERLAELIRFTLDGTLSSSLARQLFARMIDTGLPAAEIIAQEGLVQVRDDDALQRWAAEAVAAHPAEAQRYRGGDNKLLAFFMGQVMKKSGGKADPRKSSEILRALLKE